MICQDQLPRPPKLNAAAGSFFIQKNDILEAKQGGGCEIHDRTLPKTACFDARQKRLVSRNLGA